MDYLKSAQTFTVGFVKLLSTHPIHIVVWGNFPFKVTWAGRELDGRLRYMCQARRSLSSNTLTLRLCVNIAYMRQFRLDHHVAGEP